jgi:chromosome segregation ATPase
MEAVFNREAESGEFFIEFGEAVLENKLVECFEYQGAGQVTTITFANDGGDSAANALMRILQAQEKHGAHTRGERSKALQKSLTNIQNKSQPVSQQEFDEKTTAAIRLSLGNIEQGVQSQAVKLEDIEQGVQSQAAKLDDIETGVQSQAVKLEGIEQGVCHVIPDYQNEIAKLKDALAKKTAACDTIEGKLAYKTRLVNQQGKYIDKLEEEQVQQGKCIDKLEEEQVQHVKDAQAWTHEKASMQSQISALQEQLELSQYLKQTLEKSQQTLEKYQQTLEKSQHLADILSSTLADERAAKRRRE